MYSKPWAFALLSLVAIAGCGKASDPTTATTTGSGATTSAAATAGSAGASTANTPALTKLKIEDVKTGKGSAAADGDILWVFYTGHLVNPSGKVFDSTDSHGGKAFELHLGSGEVIPGWDQGLVGVKVGGERNIWIPSKLGYGVRGNDSIPPNTDLFFNIRAVAMVKKGEEDLVDAAEKKIGTGPAVKTGDKVTISYVGTLPGGEVFEETKKGKDVTFTVGKRDQYGAPDVIKGVDQGVIGMKVGGERVLTVPPKLGVPTGSNIIPADSVLIFDVKLKKIG